MTWCSELVRKQWIAATATTVFTLAAAFWSQSVWAACTGAKERTVVVRSVAPSALSPGHLYVLEHAFKAVYRFPLAADGLPAVKPDGVFYPQGSNYPMGLTVDKAGHVFIADPGLGTVDEFAAGATGIQKPISVLNLSGDDADRLNIDNAGRLYVHFNTNQDIAIFAQGAKGNDPPISIVPRYKNGYINDFVVAISGVLYTLNNVEPVAVYDDPLDNPTKPDRLIMPDGGHAFDNTLALDQATDRLYTQFYVSNPRYWDKVNYDVRPPWGDAVAAYQFIFTGDCGSAGQGTVFGTVIVKNYLIVSCNSNGDVLVYRTDQFGRQRAPVEIVGQGTLASPWEMAVGP